MYFVAKFNILKFKIRILTNSQSLFNAIVVRYKNYVEVIDENIDEKYDGEIKITEETLDKYIDKSKLPVEFNNTNLFFRNFYIGDFDFTGNSANILVEKQNSLFMFEDFITRYFSVFFINHNISLIHCSALCDKNNNVYIFFGGSGAGKSTLTANRKNLQLISEDHIIVEKIDLKKSSYYRINRTPFYRDKGLFDSKTKYQIKAFFYLIQSKEEKIEKLDPNQGLYKVLTNTGMIRGYESLFVKNNLLIYKLFSGIDCYNLYFRKETNPDNIVNLLK